MILNKSPVGRKAMKISGKYKKSYKQKDIGYGFAKCFFKRTHNL